MAFFCTHMSLDAKIALVIIVIGVASLMLATEMPLWGLILFVATGILGIITLVIVEDHEAKDLSR